MIQSSDRASCRSKLPPEALAELVRSLLADGLLVEIEVTGSSMWPFVRSGDVVTLKPLTPRTGDVVIFLDDRGRLIVHRVVKRRKTQWVTRGDAAFDADPPVEDTNILGTVTAIKRHGVPIRRGPHSARKALAVFSRLGLFNLLSRVVAKIGRTISVPFTGKQSSK